MVAKTKKKKKKVNNSENKKVTTAKVKTKIVEEKKKEKINSVKRAAEIDAKFDIEANTPLIQQEEISIEEFVGSAEKAMGGVSRDAPILSSEQQSIENQNYKNTQIKGEGQEATNYAQKGQGYDQAYGSTADKYGTNDSNYDQGYSNDSSTTGAIGGLEQIGTGDKKTKTGRELMEMQHTPESQRQQGTPTEELFLKPIGESQYKQKEELEKKRARGKRR